MPAPTTNDDTPPVKGLFSTRKRAAETVFAMVFLGLVGSWIWLTATPAEWRAIGIGIAIAAVFAFLGAGWRWWRTGRA